MQRLLVRSQERRTTRLSQFWDNQASVYLTSGATASEPRRIPLASEPSVLDGSP